MNIKNLKIAAVLLIIAMLLGMAACAGTGDAGSADMSDASQESTEEALQTDEESGVTSAVPDEVREAFIKVLEDNEKSIRNYCKMFDKDNNYYKDDNADTSAINDCVAIVDLNGDDVPELLYMATPEESIISDDSPSYGQPAYGEAYIWRYDGKTKTAVPCYYQGQSDYNDNYTPVYGAFNDVPAAGGTKYVIFTGKEKGIFHMISEISDSSAFCESYTFQMDEVGNIALLTNAVNKYSLEFDEDDEQYSDIYYVDGKEVGQSEGAAAFSDAADDFRELIMYSGFNKDISAFSHIKTDEEKAISFDEALDYLQN